MTAILFFSGVVLSAIGAVVFYAFNVLVFSFTLWMVVDAGKQDRYWWLILVVGVPVVGPLVYYFTEKKHEYKRAPHMHVERSETEEQHENAPKEK